MILRAGRAKDRTRFLYLRPRLDGKPLDPLRVFYIDGRRGVVREWGGVVDGELERIERRGRVTWHKPRPFLDLSAYVVGPITLEPGDVERVDELVPVGVREVGPVVIEGRITWGEQL